MIHPDRFREKNPSRRNFLLAVGALGAGAAVCTCGGAAGLGLARWLSDRERPPRTVMITATPQAAPQTAPVLMTYPGMVRRAAWGALPLDHNARNERGFYSENTPDGWRTYPGDGLRDLYRTVVVHHSVIYETDDNITMLEVQNAHREDRGWADIGYHFLVGKNGQVFEGRDIHARGTHVAGYNTGSVGVCLLGNFMVEYPTRAQLDSARDFIRWLAEQLALTHIAGHQAFNDWTECPGVNLAGYIGSFADAAGLTIGTEGYVAPGEADTQNAFAPSCGCCACGAVS